MLYLTQGGDWQTVRTGGYSSSDNNEIGRGQSLAARLGLLRS